MRPSSVAYVEHRVARHGDHAHDMTAERARELAERDAARLEAMGSVYDPRQRRWSPIWLRINPTHGEARRDARDALRQAIATGGGGYDSEHRLWLINDPAGGNTYLLGVNWDRRAYEAVPHRTSR